MKGLVLSLLLVLATANTEASSRLVYDLDGTPQTITVCDTMIAVKFAPGAKGLSTTFALQYDALRDNNTAYEKPTDTNMTSSARNGHNSLSFASTWTITA